MNWKTYRNELIVGFALVLMLVGLLYKYQNISGQTTGVSTAESTLHEFSTLSASELNKVLSKILNLAVEIQKLEIKKIGPSYTMEFKCKW